VTKCLPRLTEPYFTLAVFASGWVFLSACFIALSSVYGWVRGDRGA
jgi:hypothetical protein